MEELMKEIEALKAQQETLIFTEFNEETAWAIGTGLRDEAKKHHYPIAISITLNRRRLFYCSMPGAAPINDQWIRRKENLVYLFQKSSYELALYLKAKKDTVGHRYGLSEEDYAAAGGSVPLLLKGTGLVGAITVSGLSEQEDHHLVVRAIQQITCPVSG